MRRADRSTVPRDTRPSTNAVGSSRHAAVAAASRCPCRLAGFAPRRAFRTIQSLITKPSKPHSSRSTSVSSAAVLAGALAVDRVVGAHDASDALVDDRLEVRQVDLVERVLVDGDVDREPRVLHRVAARSASRTPSRAPAPRGSGAAPISPQHRVLAVGLLGPPPGGVAQQVHADRRRVVGAEGASSRPWRARRAPRAPGPTSRARAMVTGKRWPCRSRRRADRR